MKKLCLFLAIIMICCTFSACGNSNNDNDIDTEVTEAPKIEDRSELIEIMGGIMDVDVSTLSFCGWYPGWASNCLCYRRS